MATSQADIFSNGDKQAFFSLYSWFKKKILCNSATTLPGFFAILPITCHLSHVTCHLTPVICQVSPDTCHMSPVTCHLSSVICHLPPVSYHLPLIICHLSPVTWHMALIIGHMSLISRLYHLYKVYMMKHIPILPINCFKSPYIPINISKWLLISRNYFTQLLKNLYFLS